MRLITLMTALALGWSVVGAQAQTKVPAAPEKIYQPRMTKAQALAYLNSEEIKLEPDTLFMKVVNGEADTVEAMIVAGFDPNTPGRMPQSPLQTVVQTCSTGNRVTAEDRLRMIDLLIGGKIDVNHPGMAGLTALMVAAQQQCPPIIIKRLLAAGAKIDTRTPQGFTPLSMALIVANFDGAETLIEAGARFSPEVGAKFLTGTDDDPRLVELIKRATAGK